MLRDNLEAMTGRKHTTDGEPPDPDCWDAPAPRPVGSSGQHKAYWVLPAEERALGAVRPVRLSYTHVGPPAGKHPLRELTDEERTRHAGRAYAKFEAYPESESPVTGRFWTQAQLDAANGGCGAVTEMSADIAETFAKNPVFYGATFCCACKAHLPVGEAGEFVWEGTNQRVGT